MPFDQALRFLIEARGACEDAIIARRLEGMILELVTVAFSPAEGVKDGGSEVQPVDSTPEGESV